MPKGVYQRTKPAWNKGLTKEDPRVAKNIEARNATMIDKYGSLSYNNSEKRKQTNLDRYGVENTYQSKELTKEFGKGFSVRFSGNIPVLAIFAAQGAAAEEDGTAAAGAGQRRFFPFVEHGLCHHRACRAAAETNFAGTSVRSAHAGT